MKFLIIHNRYSKPGGEEQVVEFQRRMLERKGHQVVLYERSHDEIQRWPFGRVQSFFTAMYNPQAVKEIECLAEAEKPDVAIVHNLFPVISAAILPVLKRKGIKILMPLHNFRLICPIGVFYTRNELCERCGTSFWREGNCVAGKCEGSVLGSVGFAARSWFSRMERYYRNSVDWFLPQTEFQKDKLVEYGLPEERFRVLSNGVDPERMPRPKDGIEKEGYIGYAGRLSPEKGIDLLFEVAALRPERRFKVAGDFASDELRKQWSERIPENVELLGVLNREQLADFYTQAEAIIMTSKCYESFGLSVAEAMYYGTPVIVPSLGGPPEIVDHGRCGLVYPVGSAQGLVVQIDLLHLNRELAEELGTKGCRRIAEVYHPEHYYRLLIELIG